MEALAQRQAVPPPDTTGGADPPSIATPPKPNESPSEGESQQHSTSTTAQTGLARPTKDAGTGPETTSTTTGPLPMATEKTGDAIRFRVNESDGLVTDSDYYFRAGEEPYKIPWTLHPGLNSSDSPLEVKAKHICRIMDPITRDFACEPVHDSGGSPRKVLTRADEPNEVVFSLYGGVAYFLRVKWGQSGFVGDLIGWSYSQVFAQIETSVANNPDDIRALDGTFKDTWSAPVTFTDPEVGDQQFTIGADEADEKAPAELRQALDSFATGATTPGSPSSTGTGRGATISPAAEPTADSSSGSDGNGGGGGGLSTGAIAGIGVAAGIVGLALIGLLVWFFCLRNRRKPKSHGPYAAPDAQASEYMVNKETTGPHITESPHSPYSDDGSLANPHGMAHAPPTQQQQQQQHHIRQYSDAPPIAAPVPRSASQQATDRPLSRSGARSGTPAGGNVSHLIEEGMTEADIRRLEEEERALDDAIERAGHGRRG